MFTFILQVASFLINFNVIINDIIHPWNSEVKYLVTLSLYPDTYLSMTTNYSIFAIHLQYTVHANMFTLSISWHPFTSYTQSKSLKFILIDLEETA